MGSFVVQLEPLPDERLLAEATFERLDAGVFALVLQLQPVDRKLPIAEGARKRLVSGVIHLVPLAVCVVRKGD